MRTLIVGDPHVKPHNLEESERLKTFILEKAKEFNVELLIFLSVI